MPGVLTPCFLPTLTPPPPQFFRDTNGEFVTNIRLLAPGLPSDDAESKGVHEGLQAGLSTLGSPSGAGAGVGAGPPGDLSQMSGLGSGGVAGGDDEESGFTTFRCVCVCMCARAQ